MDANHYDLVVIGSGPAGQKAAIAAAKLLRRVAVIDRRFMIGGSCVHSGTIPSKTLREVVLHLDAFRERNFYRRDFSPNGGISIRDLAFRVETIVARETSVIQAQFRRNGVAVYEGTVEFTGAHTVQISELGSDRSLTLHADYLLIACGTDSGIRHIYKKVSLANANHLVTGIVWIIAPPPPPSEAPVPTQT